MGFRASFCDPFREDVIELGYIGENDIIKKFKSINWNDYLMRMKTANEDNIHYSPSLEIENEDNKNGIEISAIEMDADNNIEFYIFYKRPKLITKFFGLSKSMNEDYLTNAVEQTEKDAIDCLNALINNDLDFLESKINR